MTDDNPDANESAVEQGTAKPQIDEQETLVDDPPPQTGNAQSKFDVIDQFLLGCDENGEVPEDDEPCNEADADLLEVFDEWSGGTSMHGVPYILNHSNYRPWKRFLWLGMTLLALGILCEQIYKLVQQYRKYETNTSVQIETPRSLVFPQVVVCNVNSLQASKLSSFPKNETELAQVSQTLQDFVVESYYNNRIIENLTDHWKPLITYEGLCWQFVTDEPVRRPGLLGGLFVGFNLQSSEHLNTTGVSGLKVFVGERGTRVSYESPFHLVPGGLSTYMAVNERTFDRVTLDPWSSCESRSPMFTQASCKGQCLQQYAVQRCGCRIFDDTQHPDVDYCQDLEACYFEIIEADWEDCEDDCLLPPCQEVLYDTQYSVLTLANKNVASSLESAAYNLIGSDYVELHINFEAIRREVVTEQISKTFNQLLADFGGQMGLFAGLSFITIAELFGELFLCRLTPRLWGDRRLYGIGSRAKRLPRPATAKPRRNKYCPFPR